MTINGLGLGLFLWDRITVQHTMKKYKRENLLHKIKTGEKL